MISYPRQGQSVQIWYGRLYRDMMPLHGRVGQVRIVSRGPGPRNHGVEVDGQVYVIPRGNLRLPHPRSAQTDGRQSMPRHS
jgi:hypothetical protein